MDRKRKEEYPCMVCPIVFITFEELINHIHVHTNKPALPGHRYKCRICAEEILFAEQIILHMFQVHNKRVHICLVCGKIGKRKKWLEKHSKTHKPPCFIKSQLQRRNKNIRTYQRNAALGEQASGSTAPAPAPEPVVVVGPSADPSDDPSAGPRLGSSGKADDK